MAGSTRLAAPNSLVLLMDANGGEIPESMGGHLVAATESCVAVGCKSEVEGDTEIVLGWATDVDPGRNPDFEERMETPSRRVAVKSVYGTTLLELAIPEEEVVVRIWVNDANEPDLVIFGLV